MNLTELRTEIDRIDDQLVELFVRRMETAAKIAENKKKNGLSIHAPAREREKLQDVAEKVGPDMADYARVLYSLLFELSRSCQSRNIAVSSPLYQKITAAIEKSPKVFPQSPTVACQEAEDACSQIACEKIFKSPFIMYFKDFESVFSAIEQGLCHYGILPIENSTAGSVKNVYDLMIRYNFSIIRALRLKIDYNLLANPGASLDDVKEIYSNEQAIGQCGRFLKSMPGARVIPVENTAVAAQMASKSGRRDTAAISSRSCAELYNLTCLASSVQDDKNNRTRFICIGKNPEIYPGSDKTSIMMVLPHTPGSLYRALARIYALGINITRLESRPIPERDFEFMFYLDLEVSVYSDRFAHLICELDELCEEFKYLGSYREVM